MASRKKPPRPASTGDVVDRLVEQFTDPLACLRELIQNALDAGSDVVEVNTFREGDHGVLEVRDHGEGMDRAIIEGKLTRLFASTKDDDLTKIGKFGVGFISVFALMPEAVVVDTARGGERWRIVFAPDRSWRLSSPEDPFEGTRVRLYLRRRPQDWSGLVVEAERTVRRWCRYARQEILFDGQTVNERLALPDPDIVVHHDDGQGTELVVGLGPRVAGFYNKGLTLLEADRWEQAPFGVSFRISSRWLEHTLTRDSIVQDDHYKKAMALLQRVVSDELTPRVLRTIADPETALDLRFRLFSWLALAPRSRAHSRTPALPALDGRVWSLQELSAARQQIWGASTPRGRTIGRLVCSAEAPVFEVPAGLDLAHFPLALVHALRPVEVDFLLAREAPAALAARARVLLERTEALLRAAGLPLHGDLGWRQQVTLSGALLERGHDAEPPLCAWSDRASGAVALALPVRRATHLLVHLGHPVVVDLLELVPREPVLAAYLFAKHLLPGPLPAPSETALLGAVAPLLQEVA